LRHPAWKWSRPILKGKDKGEVTKKGKYKQDKKEASDKVNSLCSAEIYNVSREH